MPGVSQFLHVTCIHCKALVPVAGFQEEVPGEETGLSDRGLAAVIASGYTNLGQLACATGQPGQPLNEADFQRFAQNVLAGMASMADIPEHTG